MPNHMSEEITIDVSGDAGERPSEAVKRILDLIEDGLSTHRPGPTVQETAWHTGKGRCYGYRLTIKAK